MKVLVFALYCVNCGVRRCVLNKGDEIDSVYCFETLVWQGHPRLSNTFQLFFFFASATVPALNLPLAVFSQWNKSGNCSPNQITIQFEFCFLICSNVPANKSKNSLNSVLSLQLPPTSPVSTLGKCKAWLLSNVFGLSLYYSDVCNCKNFTRTLVLRNVITWCLDYWSSTSIITKSYLWCRSYSLKLASLSVISFFMQRLFCDVCCMI